MNKKNNSQRGAVMLLTVIFFLFISLSIVVGIVSPVTKEFRIARESLLSRQSYFVSESGVEDAYYRLRKSKQLSSSETITLGTSSTTTTVTDLGGGLKELSSIGDTSNYQRTTDIKVSTGAGVSFAYAILVGQGGITMSGSSGINGSVYANGPITGGSSTFITGTAISANSPSLTADQSNGTGTPTTSVTFGNASSTQDVAQSFQVATSSPINKIQVYIKKAGAPSDATVKIATDSSGAPSSTYVASGTLSASTVSTSYGWVDVSFSSNPTLTTGTTYWIVVDAATGSSTKNYILASNGSGSSDVYTSGVAKVGQYGTSWSAISSGVDFFFRVYLGGFTGSITGGGSQWNQISVGSSGVGDAKAHTVNYVSAAGSIYCQSGSGNNKSCSSLTDPSYTSLPVSAGNISDWEAAAVAGGTSTGDYSVAGSSTASLGPKKIVGNLSVGGSGTLKVTGTLWVTGNVTVNGSGILKLDSTYGANSGVIIADGTITIGGSSPVNGSGTAGSYILMLSNSDCPTSSSCSSANAIDISGSAGAVVLYAPNGTVAFSGSASAKEATGYKISLSGSTTVTYQSGLASPNFVNSPSGSYNIQSWKETQ